MWCNVAAQASSLFVGFTRQNVVVDPPSLLIGMSGKWLDQKEFLSYSKTTTRCTFGVSASCRDWGRLLLESRPPREMLERPIQPEVAGVPRWRRCSRRSRL